MKKSNFLEVLALLKRLKWKALLIAPTENSPVAIRPLCPRGWKCIHSGLWQLLPAGTIRRSLPGGGGSVLYCRICV